MIRLVHTSSLYRYNVSIVVIGSDCQSVISRSGHQALVKQSSELRRLVERYIEGFSFFLPGLKIHTYSVVFPCVDFLFNEEHHDATRRAPTRRDATCG